MNIRAVNSINELRTISTGDTRRFLLLYRKGSDQSECALKHISEMSPMEDGQEVLGADVNHVADIHPHYGVESVPTLLELKGDLMINTYKGCNSKDYYRTVMSGSYPGRTEGDMRAEKRVIVYSTPACSWCNTLKSYLRENKIMFREIDVSSDQKAAEAMVRRSGQQGVPQTDINGEMIIGFNRQRIDDLLGLRPNSKN